VSFVESKLEVQVKRPGVAEPEGERRDADSDNKFGGKGRKGHDETLAQLR